MEGATPWAGWHSAVRRLISQHPLHVPDLNFVSIWPSVLLAPTWTQIIPRIFVFDDLNFSYGCRNCGGLLTKSGLTSPQCVSRRVHTFQPATPDQIHVFTCLAYCCFRWPAVVAGERFLLPEPPSMHRYVAAMADGQGAQATKKACFIVSNSDYIIWSHL